MTESPTDRTVRLALAAGRHRRERDEARAGAGSPTDHRYVSTACFHGMHARCRLVCKFCDVPCRCVCHDDAADTARDRRAEQGEADDA